MADEMTLAGFFRRAADALEAAERMPYGPPAREAESKVAGEFLLAVAGDRDKAVAAWTNLRREFGGYLPAAAAIALTRAAFAKDLIVPDAAPEVE